MVIRKADGMATISLCMIVRNEEDVLARCLDSVRELVDEIVLVDTGSTDGTKAIAARYTDRIYDFEWIDDFSAARNYSFSKAVMEFQMWLDADDVMEEGDRNDFIQLKSELESETDVVMLPYHVAFDQEGKPTMTYYRERLLRRSRSFTWQGAVHEVITPVGAIRYGTAAVCHRKLRPSDPDRNLKIYETIKEREGITDPRSQFYYGRELYYHKRYEEAAAVFQMFLLEGRGWLENTIEACLNLSQCLENLGNRDGALMALFQSFRYDEPRPELCCAIGNWFLKEAGSDTRLLKQAVYWYSRATEGEENPKNGGFINPDCSGFIPDIQLCVCYDRMGDRENALKYHRLAGQKKPTHPSVLLNEAYFGKQNETSDAKIEA